MTKRKPQIQSLAAKQAESRRPFLGEDILNNLDLGLMLIERAKKILADLDQLKEVIPSFAPFLEIGAGSAQRSAALMNRYPVDGIATDISQPSLRNAPYVMSLLNFTRLPLLICCDAHHLPFLPNTFQFVFAYQTLHHFENPIPVVAECYRVLGKGGYLFFNEEPMDSRLRRFLRGNRTLGGSPTRLQRWSYRLHMEKLFWDDGAAERRAGITEARFGIDLWRQTLEPFSEIDVEINSHLRIHNDLKKRGVISWISGIIGGNVKGYALKAGGEPATGDFRQRLMCLDCGTNLPVNLDAQLPCEQCGRVYPFTDGILRMLPAELEVELYPQPSGISPS